MSGLLGGLSEEKIADADAQNVAEKVRGFIEEKEGKKLNRFLAVKYCTQVVAGINYFIKIQVGEDEFIHVRAYQDLQQQISLSAYQTGKKEVDPIEYF